MHMIFTKVPLKFKSQWKLQRQVPLVRILLNTMFRFSHWKAEVLKAKLFES